MNPNKRPVATNSQIHEPNQSLTDNFPDRSTDTVLPLEELSRFDSTILTILKTSGPTPFQKYRNGFSFIRDISQYKSKFEASSNPNLSNTNVTSNDTPVSETLQTKKSIASDINHSESSRHTRSSSNFATNPKKRSFGDSINPDTIDSPLAKKHTSFHNYAFSEKVLIVSTPNFANLTATIRYMFAPLPPKLDIFHSSSKNTLNKSAHISKDSELFQPNRTVLKVKLSSRFKNKIIEAFEHSSLLNTGNGSDITTNDKVAEYSDKNKKAYKSDLPINNKKPPSKPSSLESSDTDSSESLKSSSQTSKLIKDLSNNKNEISSNLVSTKFCDKISSLLTNLSFTFKNPLRTSCSKSEIENFKETSSKLDQLGIAYKERAEKYLKHSSYVAILIYLEATLAFLESFWYCKPILAPVNLLNKLSKLIDLGELIKKEISERFLKKKSRLEDFKILSGLKNLLLSTIYYRVSRHCSEMMLQLLDYYSRSSVAIPTSNQSKNLSESSNYIKAIEKLASLENNYMEKSETLSQTEDLNNLINPEFLSRKFKELWSRCFIPSTTARTNKSSTVQTTTSQDPLQKNKDISLSSKGSKYEIIIQHEIFNTKDQSNRKNRPYYTYDSTSNIPLKYPVNSQMSILDITAFCRQIVREFAQESRIENFKHFS
ncbi:hypothetical protein BB560_000938 [Smittium megazygosporum]|uniref:Uncharacterized protein n=1 Tax=Smittium megazygosporum TaxID=133381 RepID=A0A2T9ZIW1_9FUNG|nr:hypothetical protein BB560_000938 [Smittium megazygosporum]